MSRPFAPPVAPAAILLVVLIVRAAPLAAAPPPPATPAGPTADERRQIESDLLDFELTLTRLRTAASAAADPRKLDEFADANLFAKAVTWALRYDADKLTRADVAQVRKALARARE